LVSQDDAGFGKARLAASGSEASEAIFLKELLIVIRQPKKQSAERRKRLAEPPAQQKLLSDLTILQGCC
jgi:hypothetical protein